MIPLRKPKAYFASRTHTQLTQLYEDLQRTDFVKQPIIPRSCSNDNNKLQDISVSKPRPLCAVHVAGRQHMCINTGVRHRANANTNMLNELCVEAMKYERSV
uniref:ATP-dependent RNA helicase CHL1 n=1 Tax=Lygus hesperus TaxID=30085 RepID=A0A0A9WMH5_LYGHE